MSSAERLRQAAKDGDVEGIRAALADGTDIDSRDEHGWTVLMWAAHHNQRNAVDALLESGADPCVRDRLVQDAADLALHAKQEGRGDPIGLSLHIQRHPECVRRNEELANEARRFAEALQSQIRGKIVVGGQLDCHGDWRIETRYRGMTCLLWVFASGTNLWVQNYRGSGATLSYQIEDEKRAGVVGAHELRDLSTKLDEFWSEEFPVYCTIHSDKLRETSDFVRANETDLRLLRLEKYEWLVVMSKQIRMRSLTTDVDVTVERLDRLASIFERTSRPLPKPIIKKAAKIRLWKGKHAKTQGRYAHALWGMPASPLACRACQEPIHRIAVLDAADPILEPIGWPLPRLEVLMCLRCSVFAGPSWFHHSEDAVEVIDQKDAGFLDEIDPLEPLGFDLVVPARSPSGKVHKFGGRASWLQTDETPECPHCKKPMPFLLQLASTAHFSFGDEGVLYAFVCPACRTTATLVQSH